MKKGKDNIYSTNYPILIPMSINTLVGYLNVLN